MRRFLFSFRTLAALAAVSGSFCGCGGSAGGPDYAEIGIDVAEPNGALLRTECLPLPVLPGGTIVEDVELAPSLTAHLFLVRDYADITLRGTNDPYSSHLQVPEPALLAGYQKELDVTTLDSRSYVVTFVSPCVAEPPMASK